MFDVNVDIKDDASSKDSRPSIGHKCRSVSEVRAYALVRITECNDEISRQTVRVRTALRDENSDWDALQDAARRIQDMIGERAVWSEVLECVN